MSSTEPQLLVSPRFGQIVAIGAMTIGMLSIVICVFLLGQARYAADLGSQAAFASGKSQGEMQALKQQLSELDAKLSGALEKLAVLEARAEEPSPQMDSPPTESPSPASP